MRVWLTRKTRPRDLSHEISDPGHSTPRRWKRLRPPLPPKEREVRWAFLAIFFIDLGLDEVCNRGSMEPACGGNRLRGFGLVSLAEGTSALSLVHF